MKRKTREPAFTMTTYEQRPEDERLRYNLARYLHKNDLMKKHSIEHGDGAGQLCPLQRGQQLGLVIRLPLHTLQHQHF